MDVYGVHDYINPVRGKSCVRRRLDTGATLALRAAQTALFRRTNDRIARLGSLCVSCGESRLGSSRKTERRSLRLVRSLSLLRFHDDLVDHLGIENVNERGRSIFL